MVEFTNLFLEQSGQQPEERLCGKEPWNKRLIVAAAAAMLVLAQKALHGGSYAFEMPLNDLDRTRGRTMSCGVEESLLTDKNCGALHQKRHIG